jgi:hypothetical protein
LNVGNLGNLGNVGNVSNVGNVGNEGWEVAMQRACAVIGLLVISSMAPRMAAQKLTPEALVKLHLQALTSGTMPAREESRDIKGAVSAMTPARAAGQLGGTFRFSSGATSVRLNLQFGTDRYEGETFTAEGDKVDVAMADPRNGSRSAIGNFVARNRVIVGEGLIGGVLNRRWPLLDIAGRQPKLWYDGLKNLGGRDLHRLRYRAKDNQGSLEVELYFDPATYRHAASVYSSSQAQALGGTIESSSQQADQYSRIEERFGKFEQIGTLTLPRSWSIRFERTGNTANEWKYDMTVQTVEVTAPSGSQTPVAPLFSEPRVVTP